MTGELLGDLQHEPHWVYEFIDGAGHHLYVGCTSNPSKRLGSHHSKDWWDDVVRVEMDVYPNQRQALDAERERIELYQPKHNHVFTDGHDKGGWGRRRAAMKAAHDAGLLCEDRTSCKNGCTEKAHAQRIQCAHWFRCRVCVGYMPRDVSEDPRAADCWLELQRRLGGIDANELTMWSIDAFDALAADEQGLSFEQVRQQMRETLHPVSRGRAAS